MTNKKEIERKELERQVKQILTLSSSLEKAIENIVKFIEELLERVEKRDK